MAARSTLPFFLCFDSSHTIVVIGAGVIATAKILSLLQTDAKIKVIARKKSAAFNNLAARHPSRIETIEADYIAEQLDGCKLVIVATNDHELNKQIVADAHRIGALVNVVDDPDLCDGYFPAIVRRGVIQIAIGTSGVAPMLARYVKRCIEIALPAGLPTLADLFETNKNLLRKIKNTIKRRRFIENVLSGPIASAALGGNIKQAQDLLESRVAQASLDQDSPSAALYLIGAGPGNPDLITLRAIELLARAEVVLYDRLVAPEIIDRFARKDAEKILVGKSRESHFPQSKINELLHEKLKQGMCVAHVKGGDPAVFARLADELAVAQEVGAAIEIVPGVTAALGCAAYAGIPLTERGVSQSIRFITVYNNEFDSEQLELAKQNIKASPATNETLVYYMTGLYAVRALKQLATAGMPTETPVLLIEKGTTSEQRTYSAKLAQFCEKYAAYKFASPSLLIVGEVTRWHKHTAWFNANLNQVECEGDQDAA